MLIWNGAEWVQFQGSKWVGDRDLPDALQPCVKDGPLGGHDTCSQAGAQYRPVLHAFLADPDAYYTQGAWQLWKNRLSVGNSLLYS